MASYSFQPNSARRPADGSPVVAVQAGSRAGAPLRRVPRGGLFAALTALAFLVGCGDGVGDEAADALTGSDMTVQDTADTTPDAPDTQPDVLLTDGSDAELSETDTEQTDTEQTDTNDTDAAQTEVSDSDVAETDTNASDGADAGSDNDADAVGTDAAGSDTALDVDTVVLPDDCTQDADCKDPGVPCIISRCVPQNPNGETSNKVCKLVLLPNTTPCDDGQSCTSGEQCQSGSCNGGKDVCACNTSADCVAFDDDNLCNGTLYCDKTGAAPVCKTNPATVVSCAGQLGPCTASICNPSSGQCETQTAPNGTECNDGDSCSVDDTCQAGACKAGIAICQCKTTADCAGKEDGNLCNGKLYCDTNSFPFECRVNPSTIVKCGTSYDTACATNTCNPATGTCAMQLAADASPCVDANPCTSGDTCLNGKCISGPNACECTKNADCAAFEDGDLCNGTLFCNLSLDQPRCEVNPATLVTCGNGKDTECVRNLCDPALGTCSMQTVNENGACSDGNLCSSGDHCEQGACVPAAETCECTIDADCAGYEDGNACNGTLYCDKSSAPFHCKVNPATVVECPAGDDTACVQNTCDPGSGQCAMQPVNEDGPCDADDFDCTLQDTCVSGICLAGANVCKCETAGDCGSWDDGNICNGTLYCDKSEQPFVCKVNPATLKTCPTVDDTTCLYNRCEPSTGNCAMTPRNTGDVCNADDSACTVGDVCDAGACVVGTNICACDADDDCAGADDGNLCNGTFYCDKSAQPFSCKLNPATVVQCDSSSDSPCIKNTCQPKTGGCAMSAVPDNTSCSDGNACSVSDVCEGGVCKGTNICSCLSTSDCTPFDDGNLCNGSLMCDTSKLPYTCKPDEQVVSCPSSTNPCGTASCNPSTGLCMSNPDPTLEGSACDDGDACTSNTRCESGACIGTTIDCDDSDLCTFDVCIPGGGCEHTFMPSAPCDDGEACTQQDKCVQQGCAGVPVYCDDGNPCTDDACKGASGCIYLANTLACTDGNLCTIKDACVNGDCVGLPKGCTDGNACTHDKCDAGSGNCVWLPTDPTPCSDGLSCTIKDVCSAGVCSGFSACDDGDPCTLDKCLEGLPCFHDPLTGVGCDDGSNCTKSDLCNAGVCSGTYQCDDGNPCTKDSCDPQSGCAYVPLDGLPCEDNSLCTDTGVCNGSLCEAPEITCDAEFCTAVCDPDVGCTSIVPCDDGNQCTTDSCDNLAGCVYAANLDGMPCVPPGLFAVEMCQGGNCGTCSLDSFQFFRSDLTDFTPDAGLFDGTSYYFVGSGAGVGTGIDGGFLLKREPDGSNGWDSGLGAVAGASLHALQDAGPELLAFGYNDVGDDFEGQAWVGTFSKQSGMVTGAKTFGEEAQSEAFRAAVGIAPNSWLAAGTVGSTTDAGNLLLVSFGLPLTVTGSKMIAVPGGKFRPERVLVAPNAGGYLVIGSRDTGAGDEAYVVAVDVSLTLIWQHGYTLAGATSTSFADGVLRTDTELLCAGSQDVGGGTLPLVYGIQIDTGNGAPLALGSVQQGRWTSVRAWESDFLLLGEQESETGDNLVAAARVMGDGGALVWSRSVAAGVRHNAPHWMESLGSLAFVGQLVPDWLSDADGWLQEMDPATGDAWCPVN